MEGAGKYDDQCTLVRHATDATAVMVLVVGGNKGTGMSVQAESRMHPEMICALL